MTTWPSHYPCGCPPGNAKKPDGSIYRFTNRINPKYTDFISCYERESNKNRGSDECKTRGLSVYTTQKDCDQARLSTPALRKKKLAKATLPPDSGLIAATPSKANKNHKTFWSLIHAEELAGLFRTVSQVL